MGDVQQLGNRKEIEATIPIAEIFGPTIQGEGRYTGTPCYFIRVGGCDYRCAWCDSMHAVEPAQVRQLPRYTAPEIVQHLKPLERGPQWVVISGGNPLLYDLRWLVEQLHAADYQVMIETQGSRWKEWVQEVDHITISPKGPSAKLSESQVNFQVSHVKDFVDNWWDSQIRPTMDLKVPVFNREDYLFARELHRLVGLPLYLSVGNDTGQDTTESLLNKYRQLIEWTIRDSEMWDVRIMPQMHVLLWGNKRGV